MLKSNVFSSLLYWSSSTVTDVSLFIVEVKLHVSRHSLAAFGFGTLNLPSGYSSVSVTGLNRAVTSKLNNVVSKHSFSISHLVPHSKT